MEKNIFGEPLMICSKIPTTGYFRDGFCRTINQDTGTHTVCAVMTEEFLEFSASKGNDLISKGTSSAPEPAWGDTIATALWMIK